MAPPYPDGTRQVATANGHVHTCRRAITQAKCQLGCGEERLGHAASVHVTSGTDSPDNLWMSDLQRKKRGAPKKAELAWKLEVVDALLWMGGGEMTVWDAVRAVAQVHPGSFNFSVSRALECIAGGNDVLSDSEWRGLHQRAVQRANRRYGVADRAAAQGKPARRYDGFVRAERARLHKERRIAGDSKRLILLRALEADANALQTAFYARHKAQRAADPGLVSALLSGDPCRLLTQPSEWLWG